MFGFRTFTLTSRRGWWRPAWFIARIHRNAMLTAALALLPAAPAVAEDDRVSQVLSAAVQDRVPEGLSASDWSGIRAAYETGRHAAFPALDGPKVCQGAVDGCYQARNPGQRWRTLFDGRGFVTTPDAGGWTWGLELVGYGRDGAERAITGLAPVTNCCGGVAPAINRCEGVAQAHSRCGQRVEYGWDDTLTEWYVNDRRGLEHGYTVHRRPEGLTGGTPAPPLHFTLAVRGDLRPRISGDGRGVTFVNVNRAAVVHYAGLAVFDADGTSLPAWFADAPLPQSSGLRLQAFRIVVDDRGARYPVTIDPLAQQAYLKASNTGADDRFGCSVAVSGDTAVVGTVWEDSSATGINGNQADNSAMNSGVAYVFVRDADGIWSQQAYLKASNSQAGDVFGVSVAVSGDTVVVGAPSEDSNAGGVNGNQSDNSASASGAAYVFVRDSAGVWSQQAYLKASNTTAGDGFGQSVAVSGDTVVVGATAEDSNAKGVNGNQGDDSAADSGAAYVFIRSGTTWIQQAYLKPSNTGASDFFGNPVAVAGDTAVVGAYSEDSDATGVDGDQADNSASDSGAAYVFVRSGTTWSQQAYLKASNTATEDFFGDSVAVSGDTVVVGASGEDSNATGVDGDQADNSATYSGAAYVFVRDDTGVWIQQAYLKASNSGADDDFGISVAVSGDTAVVGAMFEASNATGVNGDESNNSAGNSGAAYVFVRSPGAPETWSQRAFLKASNTGVNDHFGLSVAASRDTVVVAAPDEDSNAGGVNGDQGDDSAGDSGAAYVFVLDTDGDGVRDSLDGCPTDSNKTAPGACGCGVAEDDGDADGIADCVDNCIDVANTDQEDADSDSIGDACEEQPVAGACCGGGLPVALPLVIIAERRRRKRGY